MAKPNFKEKVNNDVQRIKNEIPNIPIHLAKQIANCRNKKAYDSESAAIQKGTNND